MSKEQAILICMKIDELVKANIDYYAPDSDCLESIRRMKVREELVKLLQDV